MRFYPLFSKSGILYMIKTDEYDQIYNKSLKKFNDEYLTQLIESYASQ